MRKLGVAALVALLTGCGNGFGDGETALPETRSAVAKRCPDPGEDWESLAPAELGLDAAKLQAVLDWSNLHSGLTTSIYRHGCLAAESRLDAITRNQPLDGWSATKSVTSMVVGRAVTLGLFDIDAPIGRWVPEADAAHAALTARHLLTMTSGLELNYIRDFLLPLPDRVCDALALQPVNPPGARWQYAQTTLDLLVWTVEKAIGRDFQEFAQAELFGPIGIAAGSWTWDRDPHGHTNAWAHLKLRGRDWAKLGQLMLQNGEWGGQQILSTSYVAQALSGHPDNPSYGLLFWMNGGPWWRVPDVEGPDDGIGMLIPAGVPDMFMMVGLGEQRVFVIPSRDLVIVRVGERGSHELDTRVTLWSGRAGQVDHELVRGVLAAVTDVPYADPGPYQSAGIVLGPVDDGIVGDAQDLPGHVEGMTTPACH